MPCRSPGSRRRRHVVACALGLLAARSLSPCAAPGSCFAGRPAPLVRSAHELSIGRAEAGRQQGAGELPAAEQAPDTWPEEEEEEEGESEDFFISIFGLLTGASSLGLLFSLPRLVAAGLAVPGAPALGDVARDAGINAAVTAFFAVLFKLDLDRQDALEQGIRERALAARLQVRLPGTATQRLDSLLSPSGTSALRAVLCLGGAEFSRACAGSVQESRAVIERAGLLPVLVPLDGQQEPDEALAKELAEAAGSCSVAALGSSEDWGAFCSSEFDRVREQGVEKFDGLVVVLSPDARIQGRFLGVPDWRALAAPPPGA